MFGIFKRKNNTRKKSLPQMADLNDQPLAIGDHVISLRYELGECKIVETEKGVEYESLESGKRVNWVLMIDAATEKQKVEKVIEA